MIRFAVVNLIKFMRIGWVLSSLSILFLSCSYLPSPNSPKVSPITKGIIQTSSDKYSYTDFSGSFTLVKKIDIKQTKLGKQLIVKNKLFEESQNIPIEKITSFSQLGKLTIKNKKVPVLRPYASFAKLWVEKKENNVQMVFDYKKRKLKVSMQQENNKTIETKEFNVLANGNGMYCFYSQLIECIRYTGFFQVSQKLKDGEVDLYIIWDAYPFFQRRVGNNNLTPFSKAQFSYDGMSEDSNLHKYVLEVENQNIFYQLDSDGVVQKQHWISQGMSQEKL